MILGRFYFKQTVNGNLLGEFSNDESPRNVCECSNIVSGLDEPFIGQYRSTWFERTAQSLTLEIGFKEDTNNTIYTLQWRNNRRIIFHGEGFLVDDILIGDYRDFEMEDVFRAQKPL